ncbi:MAG TPA: TetR/AcrR family transcriptional regulator [Anaeromyxobacter sp.]|nr:TetR/AcrR family transcriptional regulator [Anaeromyxobacter sp.]
MSGKSRRPRDAGATRAALLEQATREFADRGYDGARIDEIAVAAAINKRMIYAYFGDKDGLYRAVLDACLAQALKLGQEGAVPPGASPRARAEAIIRRFFDYLSDHPDFVRLLSWEALSRERRGRKILLPRLEAGLAPLRAILKRGVEEGDFRDDLEPRVFVLTVNALLLGYFNQVHLVEALWNTSLGSRAARQTVLGQFLHILLDGIGARP